MSAFASGPVEYLRAICSSLMQHLVSVGTIINSAFDEDLTEESYNRIRSVLLGLANLLGSPKLNVSTSDELRAQVSRLDIMTVRRGQRREQLMVNGQHGQRSITSEVRNQSVASMGEGLVHFSPDLFEHWSGAFDFIQE